MFLAFVVCFGMLFI